MSREKIAQSTIIAAFTSKCSTWNSLRTIFKKFRVKSAMTGRRRVEISEKTFRARRKNHQKFLDAKKAAGRSEKIQIAPRLFLQIFSGENLILQNSFSQADPIDFDADALRMAFRPGVKVNSVRVLAPFRRRENPFLTLLAVRLEISVVDRLIVR